MLADFLGYLFFRSFLLVISFLPFRIIVILGRLIGRAYYLIDSHHRRIIKANISVVFGRELDNKKGDILGRESCELFFINVQ